MSRGASPAMKRERFPVEPNSAYPYQPGSVGEVVAHLALWGETVPDGLARVEYFAETLRDRAIEALRQHFTAHHIPFQSIAMPTRTPAAQVARFLLEQFRQRPEGIVSLNWSAEVFPKETP